MACQSTTDAPSHADNADEHGRHQQVEAGLDAGRGGDGRREAPSTRSRIKDTRTASSPCIGRNVAGTVLDQVGAVGVPPPHLRVRERRGEEIPPGLATDSRSEECGQNPEQERPEHEVRERGCKRGEEVGDGAHRASHSSDRVCRRRVEHRLSPPAHGRGYEDGWGLGSCFCCCGSYALEVLQLRLGQALAADGEHELRDADHEQEGRDQGQKTRAPSPGAANITIPKRIETKPLKSSRALSLPWRGSQNAPPAMMMPNAIA